MDGLSTFFAASRNRSSAQPRGEFFAGLSKKDAYIRLIDAYRLRVDDDYAWGGCNLHGLYAKEPPLPDFQEFMRLAAKHKVLPTWWGPADDVAIEKIAMTEEWANINYAVEKSDITEHYDSSTPLMLRIIAEKVYNWSLQTGQPSFSDAPGCASCGQAEGDNGVKLKKCGACGEVSYCSVECQKKHWKRGGHKQACAKGKALLLCTGA